MLSELCKGDRPLALFPVRLETRFFPQPNGGSELRVRVYPDRIHIDSHEEELTPAEKTWGQHYWTQIFARGRRHAGAEERVAAAGGSIRSAARGVDRAAAAADESRIAHGLDRA